MKPLIFGIVFALFCSSVSAQERSFNTPHGGILHKSQSGRFLVELVERHDAVEIYLLDSTETILALQKEPFSTKVFSPARNIAQGKVEFLNPNDTMSSEELQTTKFALTAKTTLVRRTNTTLNVVFSFNGIEDKAIFRVLHQ
jgi:hypothetical protein